MNCQHCQGPTRVVHTQAKADGTHRWLRCQSCGELTRTLERYLKQRPGPRPGTPRSSPAALGERNGAAVLTAADVQRLRQQAAARVPQAVLAQQFGIAKATVSRIVTRKLWSHLP